MIMDGKFKGMYIHGSRHGLIGRTEENCNKYSMVALCAEFKSKTTQIGSKNADY
jgi:hypothetical protein